MPPGLSTLQGSHSLRSGASYQDVAVYTKPNPAFRKTFRQALTFFQHRQAIPMALLADLDRHVLTSADFNDIVASKEEAHIHHVYLDQGKIRFNHFTLHPHGDIIIEVVTQLSAQDPQNLFTMSTGQSIVSPIPLPPGRFRLTYRYLA